MISNFLNKVSGDIGEYITKYYLKASTDAIILRDVFIETDEGNTSQIDIVMIGSKGVYVIEVKNYADANIYGNGKNRITTLAVKDMIFTALSYRIEITLNI